MNLRVALVLFAVMAALASGCKHSSSQPSRTVKDFIEKIDKNDVEGPVSLLSTHYLSGPGGANFARGMVVFSMGALRDAGGIKSVETVTETIKGDSAQVRVRLIYNSGKYEELTYNLVKENNQWKIDSF